MAAPAFLSQNDTVQVTNDQRPAEASPLLLSLSSRRKSQPLCAGHRENGSRPGWQALAEVTSGKGRDMGKEDLVGPVLHQWGKKLLLNPKTGFLNMHFIKKSGAHLPVTPRASGFHSFAFQSTIMKRTPFLGVSSKRSCRLCYRTMKFYRVILNSMSNCYQVCIDLVISFIFIISVNNFCYMNLILSVSMWSWSLYLITTPENLTICSCFAIHLLTTERQKQRNTEKDREIKQVDFGMLFTDAICGGRILGNQFSLID